MPVESLIDSTLTDLPRLAKEGPEIDAFLAVARQAAVARATAPKPTAAELLAAPKPTADKLGDTGYKTVSG